MSDFLQIRTATLQRVRNVAVLQERRLPGCCNTQRGKKPPKGFFPPCCTARGRVALRFGSGAFGALTLQIFARTAFVRHNTRQRPESWPIRKAAFFCMEVGK